jgi:hypothetical protein
MSAPDDMAERHSRALAELTELGLSLARALHEKAVTADDPKLANDFALGFQRVSRSVRQSMALEAKLERDRRRAAAEVRDYPASRQAEQARALARETFARKSELRNQVRALLWEEYERFDFPEEVEAAFTRHIDQEAALGGFLAEPVEDQCDRLFERLRAVLERAGAGGAGPGVGTGPEAEAAPRGADAPWRSSA